MFSPLFCISETDSYLLLTHCLPQLCFALLISLFLSQWFEKTISSAWRYFSLFYLTHFSDYNHLSHLKFPLTLTLKFHSLFAPPFLHVRWTLAVQLVKNVRGGWCRGELWNDDFWKWHGYCIHECTGALIACRRPVEINVAKNKGRVSWGHIPC